MTRLEVRGLTVRFGPVDAVTDVDLDLAAGTVTGLIGPNGAGKTTVIDALTGFVPVTSGRISVDGKAVERLPAHVRARLGLGRTFQSLELFEDLTVGENLLVAAEAAGGGADWAEGGAGLGGAADLLPAQLSNAQRRLVALTRAVAGRPTVLLLDEPAAGLDPAGRQALGVRLRRLADDGAAVLLVDHDLDLVLDVCDSVTVLDRGRVIAAGSPAALRADPAVQAAYFGMFSGGFRTAPVQDPPPNGLAAAAAAGATPALEIRGLSAGYGRTEVVHDVDLEVGAGEMVALLGRNGAGKTTTLLATAGALPRAATGEVRIAGASVPRGRPDVAARRGLACVPQERSLFTQLSVAENLRLAVAGGRRTVTAETERAVARFPALAGLLDRRAGLLSGGEQRMVAVARALARHPKVLLVDEMSLGLGPRVVDDLGRVLRSVAEDEGTGVLLVEQHLDVALALASRAYVMDRGRVVDEGPSAGFAVS
ncbi:MAG: branched-chain amino acid transport system ATP-binding protein livF [Actinomycetota bacterium]|nr:branched-chain amino acid transport system ATP-binding protein livF [Actinomycetota bacterium]